MAGGRSQRFWPHWGQASRWPPSAGVRQSLDGAEHLQLLIAETRPVAVQKTIALRAEDVGHLHGRPCHVWSLALPLIRLNPWRASFTSESAMLSSGLTTACRCLADRCRYFAVVSRSPWPSST